MKAGAHFVIVGNGPVPESAARAVASADCVIRFNDCRSWRAGERTDVVAVCNTGRPARRMLGGDALADGSALAWSALPAVIDAGAIWCVRPPSVFAALRAPLAISHPELDDFCDDETDGFAAFAAATGKAFRVLDVETHRSVDAALAAFAPARYVVPSSGLMVIADLVFAHPPADIAITGFTHLGWDGHPFATEALLVDRWVAEGRLRRLGADVPARIRSGSTDKTDIFDRAPARSSLFSERSR